ncbi:MAG: hypothetical protein H6838_13020 [Planctomycetes bacterium]|nr:hypothetical protein [Planctomycetota bacterium]MCB9886410.1 hypothetical protein [Planctomycetota bacterium]
MLLLPLALAACASTKVEGTWMRPGFPEKPIKGPVLVVGVARDDTLRRIYEDRLVKLLKARGLFAMPSYETVPGVLEQDANEKLMTAARTKGARFLLSSALIGEQVEQVVTHEPSMYMGGPYRGWYGSYWGMSYGGRTEVRTYNVLIAQTSLVDVGEDRIEWTARTRTTVTSDMAAETEAFADVVIEAMSGAHLVGRPN